MGTNCAPLLANLYLYAYESQWMDKVSRANIDRARIFHLSFRYIDDLLSLDNPHADDFMGQDGPYPKDLKLNDTSDNKSYVNFLGMSILANSNRFWCKLFDKRLSFPFKIQRYPSILSNIPISVSKNVFIGQLHRFYFICSNYMDFINASVDLARIFLNKGFKSNLLKVLFKRFCQKPIKYSYTSKIDLVAKFNNHLHRGRH